MPGFKEGTRARAQTGVSGDTIGALLDVEQLTARGGAETFSAVRTARSRTPDSQAITRRDFVRRAGFGAGAGLVLNVLPRDGRAANAEPTVPAYLRGHDAEFRSRPREAALRWFREARLGLFVHYNVTSLLPGGKFDPTPPGINLEELCREFRAERFNAEEIADLAVAAGARYLCFTPYHGGGPYLWRTEAGGPTAIESAGRDLVAEMTEACRRRGLGYFHYVHFTLTQSHDAVWEANQTRLRELATRYGPIAGWWLDTSSRYRERPELYPRIRDTFALLRSAQPPSLVSFCEGPTGDEDYLTFEHHYRGLEDYRGRAGIAALHRGKPVEICTTLQLDRPGGRGTRLWFNVDRAYHRNVDEVWAELAAARRHGANFLLNTGPRGDGSVHPADAAALRSLGERLRNEGFPAGGGGG